MKFRKKPVVIEAEQYFPGRTIEGVVVMLAGSHHPDLPEGTYIKAWIDTLEGAMEVMAGDWVITGVKGEKYPCKPDIFEATYEAMNDSGQPELTLAQRVIGNWDNFVEDDSLDDLDGIPQEPQP